MELRELVDQARRQMRQRMAKPKPGKTAVPQRVLDLIKKKSGIHLDVGCGASRQPGWVGLDIRPLPNVDIVWDFEQFPYPLPDECCRSILLSHVTEHVDPAQFGFINFMNEMWRLLKVNGRAMIVTPYAGSHGYWQDPTHVNGINETTWTYFDPDHRYRLYDIYKPKPWHIVANAWCANGNMEVVLEKLPGDYVSAHARASATGDPVVQGGSGKPGKRTKPKPRVPKK